jgi:ATP-dependent DNA helicase DinG
MITDNMMQANIVTDMNCFLAEEATAFLRYEVAGKMEDHETRQSQIDMMVACAETIEAGGTLMAEAGTGTGKTFAYLIPLILSEKKAIVATRTKNLQEQLASKDLAFLSALREFSYAVAKGRGNYICLRRLNALVPENVAERSDYQFLLKWSAETSTGEFEEFTVSACSLHGKVRSDADACRKSECLFHQDCFYYKAKRQWGNAQIVVVNHALLAVNAVLPHNSKILPFADVLVIDEGHALDAAFSDKLGISISEETSENVVCSLLRMDKKGLFRGPLTKAQPLFSSVEYLRSELTMFWSMVVKGQKNRAVIGDEFTLKEPLLRLADSIKHFRRNIRSSVRGLFHEDEEMELNAKIAKLGVLAHDMETFAVGVEGYVRWPEIEGGRIALRMAPIYPKKFVGNRIIPDYKSIILTSATLSTGGDFSLTRKVIGPDDCRTLSFPSPYDVRNQVSIIIKRDIDLRKDDKGVTKLHRALLEEANKKGGGILVLFTSREIMNKVWHLASDELCATGYIPMIQGEFSNRTMLERMRESTNTVIFGLDSFWDGVDIKGDSLRSLIITKLPFEVPTEPIVMARMEEIRRSGGDPFNQYSVPRAILKFRQGVGRLIRSKSDTGRVIICDERIETKGYGKRFLKSIY